MKKIGVILLISSIVSVLCSSLVVHGKEYAEVQKNTDIIFVIDYSGSMEKNDSRRIGIQMIQAYIDNLFSSKVRVGFVAFNDRLMGSSRPVSIQTKNQRTRLKRRIASVERSGNTDIGLALRRMTQLVTPSSERKTRVILISDGEPDLTGSDTGRTIRHSYRDMDRVADWCAKRDISIDTIAFGRNFSGQTTSLQKLSDTSKGKMVRCKSPYDLIGIFGEMIEQDTYSSVVPVSASLMSGGRNEIRLPLKDTYADEINVLAVSSRPIVNATTYYNGGNISYAKAGYYFTCKIRKPNNSDIRMIIQGRTNQEISVYLLLYKDADFVLDIPDQIEQNQPLVTTSFFYQNQNKSNQANGQFYKQLQVSVQAQTDNNQMARLIQDEGYIIGNQFQKDLTFPESGRYSIQYELENEYFSVKKEAVITVVPPPPKAPWWKTFFPYMIGTALTVGVIAAYFAWIYLKQMKIRYIAYERVIEEREKEIEINSVFTGKLNAYFTEVPDEDMEIEPLTFALYQIKDKSITLEQLLESVDYTYPLKALEGENIIFKATTGRTITLYHNSNCSIMLGTSIVCKKIKYSVEYGNKIYITSSDGEYELELHYVSARS